MAGPTGIEPATYGLRVRRSDLAELRAHKSAFRNEPVPRNLELSVSLRSRGQEYCSPFEILDALSSFFSLVEPNNIATKIYY
jgi:hypothetical protein